LSAFASVAKGFIVGSLACVSVTVGSFVSEELVGGAFWLGSTPIIAHPLWAVVTGGVTAAIALVALAIGYHARQQAAFWSSFLVACLAAISASASVVLDGVARPQVDELTWMLTIPVRSPLVFALLLASAIGWRNSARKVKS